MSDFIAWFEQLCLELSTNPRGAAGQFEALRNSETALESCQIVVQSPTTSPLAKFHALAAAQYALFTRWNSGSSCTAVMQWNQFLEHALSQIALTRNNSLPSYLTQKIIQFYVSIQKRAWPTMKEEERAKLFSMAVLWLRGEGALMGSRLLLCALEDFSSLLFSDYGLTLTAFNQAKIGFEKSFLEKIFVLVLSQVMDLTIDPVLVDWRNANLLELLLHLFKIINQCITWECGEKVSVKGSEEQEGSGQPATHNPLPAMTPLIIHDLLPKAFALYAHLRMLPTNSQAVDEKRVSLLLELKTLLSSLSLINNKSLTDEANKVMFVDLFLAQSLALSQPHVQRQTMQLLTFDSDDYELEGNQRAEELLFFVLLFTQLLQTQGLKVLGYSAYFGPVVSFLGQLTQVINGEFGALIADVMLLSARSNYESNGLESDILHCWRYDLLSGLLEVWVSLQDDHTLLQTIQWTVGQKNGSTTGEQLQLANNLTTFLSSLSLEIFPSLFSHLVLTFTSLCLQEVDVLEDEDRERISEDRLHDWLVRLATFARMNISSSLMALNQALQSMHADLLNMANNRNKDIYCLEYIRLSILILSYLLVDDFASDGNSDTPVITVALLEGLKDDCNIHLFIKAMEVSLMILQQQLSASATSFPSHACKDSPAVIESIFNLFTALLSRFIDPNTENYNANMLAIYPFLSSTLQGALWDGLVELLLQACVNSLKVYQFELSVTESACLCLDAFQRSSNLHRLQQLHSILSRHQMELLHITMQLKGEVLTRAVRSVFSLTLKLRMYEFIQQIFAVLMENLSTFQDLSDIATGIAQHSAKRSRGLAMLSAVVSLPASEVDNSVFDAVHGLVQILTSSSTRGGKIVLDLLLEQSEELVDPLLRCLELVMEHLLLRLPEQTTKIVYVLLMRLFEFFQRHILRALRDRMDRAAPNEMNALAESLCEKLVTLLSILNSLSLKEFIMFDESLALSFLSGWKSKNDDNVLPHIVLYALSLLLPFCSVAFLKEYKELSEALASLIVYIASSFKDTFIVWMQSLEADQWRYFLQIIFNLSMHIKPSIARQAFQALQMMASYEVESRRLYKQTLFPGKDMEFVITLRFLLRMCLAPQLLDDNSLLSAVGNGANIVSPLSPHGPLIAKGGLIADRQDAFANTMIAFIVLCGSQIVQDVIAETLQQDLHLSTTAPIYGQFFHYFGLLLSDRGVNLSAEFAVSLQKANRQLFVMNFREFVVHVSALSIAVA